ncbi:hypothetical protein ACYOEI_23295 [Singulisphaera rosea]
MGDEKLGESRKSTESTWSIASVLAELERRGSEADWLFRPIVSADASVPYPKAFVADGPNFRLERRAPQRYMIPISPLDRDKLDRLARDLAVQGKIDDDPDRELARLDAAILSEMMRDASAELNGQRPK